MEKENHVYRGCGAESVQLRYFGYPGKLPDTCEDGALLCPEDWVERQEGFQMHASLSRKRVFLLG